MLVGYVLEPKADESQTVDLQRDALLAAGVVAIHIYEDKASGKTDARPGLDAQKKALRDGDTLVVWKLDRLGRDLRDLVNTIHDLTQRGIGFNVQPGCDASTLRTTGTQDACQETRIDFSDRDDAIVHEVRIQRFL